ncbi:hypothetical protein [Enterocloster bolteae]|uniref:hypothetical protein n=1 Tax=Enterocloster bolteae TaxID=208479 RepID=UPI00210A3EED|nr:hypothetical protein [Enterocloster bolteae]MCQ5146255.1 hypothetical protein [Enterocloster bolteae]
MIRLVNSLDEQNIVKKKIGILLKTYYKDADMAYRLINSYLLYNIDNIPLYIVLPKADFTSVFKQYFESLDVGRLEINILFEELFSDKLSNKVINWMNPGYINQEIIKLCFWELGYVENYFCVDSDAVFIREFRISDFIERDGYPFTVLIDDGPIYTCLYYDIFRNFREKYLEKIRNCLDIEEKLLSCHGFQIFNSYVLEVFKNEFMKEMRLDYVDLMKIGPYEFSWYTYFIQKARPIPIHISSELIKTFHTQEQYIWTCLLGYKLNDLRNNYLGYIINSNYTQSKSIEYGDIDSLRLRLSRNRLYFFKKIWRHKCRSLT